jgi:cysteine desulfurase/selenocysteine lyase
MAADHTRRYNRAMAPRVYLDNAATSFPKPESVLAAVVHYSTEVPASAGRGAYREAVIAGEMLAELRATLCRLFNGTRPERVVFGLNGTDALNVAIKGDHVITTWMDHNSVLRPLARLEQDGIIEVTRVRAGADGVVDPADVAAAFEPHTRLVVMTHASNVGGGVQPAAEVGRLARGRGALFLLDAAQTMGSIPVDVEAMSVDLLAFPGHKAMMGPQGTGVLWMREGVLVRPLREGGTGSRSDLAVQPDFLPDRYEPGAHNGPGLAGLLAAARFVEAAGVEAISARKREITRRFLDGFARIPGCRVHGPAGPAARVPIFAASFEGADPARIASALDEQAGVKVRAGLHCAPLAHRTFGTFDSGGSVRFSPGSFTTDAEVVHTFEAVDRILGRAAISSVGHP